MDMILACHVRHIFILGVEQNQNRNFVQEPKFLLSAWDCKKYRHTGYNCQDFIPVHLYHFHFLKQMQRK